MKMHTKYKRWSLPLLLSLLLIGTAYFVSENYYQMMMIQGDSMEPNLHNMQIVVLKKNMEKYLSGQVVAFYCDRLSTILVKRIVGNPGDTVVIKDGTLLVNGSAVSFYPKGCFEYAGILDEEIRLSEEQYIVIGDNYSLSKDSRYGEVGIVKMKDIIGGVAG